MCPKCIISNPHWELVKLTSRFMNRKPLSFKEVLVSFFNYYWVSTVEFLNPQADDKRERKQNNEIENQTCYVIAKL